MADYQEVREQTLAERPHGVDIQAAGYLLELSLDWIVLCE